MFSRPFVALDGDLPVLEADEQILATIGSVHLFREKDEGSGKVFVTSQRLIWAADSSVEAGLGWHFRSIALHAIARSSENFARPSVYCQLGVEPEHEDDPDIVPQELRLVPKDDLELSKLFEAMSSAAALNPDPMSEESWGDEDMPDVEINMGEHRFEDEEEGEN